MNELQAGIELALAVFPQPSVFFQPRKTAFNNPTLRHHLERVSLTALGDLHADVLAKNGAYPLDERRSGISAIAQYARDPSQTRRVALKRLQRTLAIRDLGGRHGNGVRQALCINRNVPLDPRDFLACVIPLLSSAIRVLHALRVHDQERAAGVAPLFLASRANLIFLKPAPAGCHLHVARSIS